MDAEYRNRQQQKKIYDGQHYTKDIKQVYHPLAWPVNDPQHDEPESAVQAKQWFRISILRLARFCSA